MAASANFRVSTRAEIRWQRGLAGEGQPDDQLRSAADTRLNVPGHAAGTEINDGALCRPESAGTR